jgi:hypothetical protein
VEQVLHQVQVQLELEVFMEWFLLVVVRVEELVELTEALLEVQQHQQP